MWSTDPLSTWFFGFPKTKMFAYILFSIIMMLMVFIFVFFCSWLHCLVQCVGYVCLSSFHHHHWLFFIFFFHHHHHRFVLENLFVFSLALLLLIEHFFRLAVLFCFSYSIFGVCLFICFFFLFLDHNSIVYRYKDDHIIIIIVID